MARVQVHEVVVVLGVGYSWDTTLEALHAASKPHSEGRSEGGTHSCIGPEGELVLLLNIVSVLPGPSLGVGHVLAGVKTYPGVVQELVVQPIISNYKIAVMEEQ